MAREIDDFLALIVMLIGLVALGFIAAWGIWGKDRTLECNVKVDGKVYKCSTAPKISSDKVIKFLNDDRYVEIPVDKEVIITFDK